MSGNGPLSLMDGQQHLTTLAAKNANANPAFSKDAILARSIEIARFSVKKWPLTEADFAE